MVKWFIIQFRPDIRSRSRAMVRWLCRRYSGIQVAQPQILLLAPGVLLWSCLGSAQPPLPEHQSSSNWYKQGRARLEAQPLFNTPLQPVPAKNVIVFIGDGMGVSTVTAARILQGQKLGLDGEEHLLSFEHLPFTAMSKTYNVDAQTPDSAGTMTAMMTGVKTNAGVIGVDEQVIRGDCQSQTGRELVTAFELAEVSGRATGLVTTARLTHATPAATYAKSVDRDWEDISTIPLAQQKAGCTDIAAQLIDFKQRLTRQFPTAKHINGPEVLFGGGRRHFLPKRASDNSPDASSPVEGDRTDGRHLIQEWQSLYPRGQYVFDQKGFDTISSDATHVLGLFSESHMRYESDRQNDKAGEPSLSQMTGKAIELLRRNNNGYFLMVEAGRIDHGHHANNAYNALHDTLEFAKAVSVALAKVDLSETLVLVTADHSHVFTIAGYPKRGNPVLGKVRGREGKLSLAGDGRPYTTLGYANGPSAFGTHKGCRHDLSEVPTHAPTFLQEATLPLKSETHGGEDVVVYGTGPGAENIMGTLEQHVVYHIVNHAGQLEDAAAIDIKKVP